MTDQRDRPISNDASRSPRDVSTSYALEPGASTSSHVSSNTQHRPSQGEALFYDPPNSFRNLNDAQANAPVQNTDDSPICRFSSREDRYVSSVGANGLNHSPIRAPTAGGASEQQAGRRRSSGGRRSVYEAPDSWENLDEVAAVSPVENFQESSIYRHHSLEEGRTWDQDRQRRRRSTAQGDVSAAQQGEDQAEQDMGELEADPSTIKVSRFATQLYTLSYLIFFSLLGTLARIGLTALTAYPSTPVIFTTIWANFGGSLIMGFLAEDRMLFRDKSNGSMSPKAGEKRDEESGSSSDPWVVNREAARKAHLATKKTIPLYVGLATGFCGSFTSFSSFIRDVFLALSNDLSTPGAADLPTSRNGGYSFMSLVAVILTTVSLSLSGLFVGAHLAIASESLMKSMRYPIARSFLDPLGVFLGWGCWLGAILLSIFPPHDVWRGRATFALVFAPLGCLGRFYLALYLNGKIASFPLGTFAANVSGTVVLGMAWDIAHASIGGVVGCQVLQGIEDGFCGCLTTISTWVAELSSLRRRHAYIYGLASIAISLGLMIIIMGGLRWTDGFSALQCST